MKHFWPCVGKVNISLIGGSFFQCLVKNTKILYFCRNFTFLYFFQKKNNLTQKKLLPLKAILTLQTWGQKCFVSESEPFEMIWFGSPFNHQNWNFWPFAIKLKGLFKILFFQTYLSNPLLDMFPTCNDNMTMFFRKFRRNAHFDFVILSFIQRSFVFKVFEVLFLFIRLGWFLKEWFAFKYNVWFLRNPHLLEF